MSSELIMSVIKYAIALLIGGSVGGLVGFKIGISKSIKQNQSGGDNAHMTQVGEVHCG